MVELDDAVWSLPPRLPPAMLLDCDSAGIRPCVAELCLVPGVLLPRDQVLFVVGILNN